MNIIFDIDDTLYDQLEPFERAFKEVFKGAYEIPCERLYVQSRKHSDEVFHLTEDGLMSIEDMHVYRITKAFEDFHLTITRDQALKMQHAYSYYQSRISLVNGMDRVLAYCKEKDFTLAIITNGPANHQKRKYDILNLRNWIDEQHLFISENIQIAKPDRRLFYYVQEKLNMTASETFYVGDSFNNDVVGAKSAGWKMIWWNKREYSVPLNNKYLPDYLVKNAEELLDLLQQLEIKRGGCLALQFQHK